MVVFGFIKAVYNSRWLWIILMELPFILALLYSLQLLATFVALKASVKSELKYTKITIQSLNNKKITAETQPNQ